MSYGAVAKANLRAVGRSVKIVRERDRTHGFVAAELSQRAGTGRIAAPAQNPLALSAPPFVRLQMAPQAIEKAQNERGVGAPFARRLGDEPCPKPDAFPPLTSRPANAAANR